MKVGDLVGWVIDSRFLPGPVGLITHCFGDGIVEIGWSGEDRRYKCNVEDLQAIL